MPAGAWVARSVVQVSSGLTINYKVGLPAGSVAGFPIDICIAGSVERGTDNTSQLTWGGALHISGLLAAGTYDGICIAPQIPNDGTAATVAHECIPQMIAATISEFSADSTRVALNGSSYGGSLAFALMLKHPELYSCVVATPGLILMGFSNGGGFSFPSDAAAGAASVATYGNAPIRMFTGDTDATYTPAMQNTTAGYFTGASAPRFGQRGGAGIVSFVSDHAGTPALAFADGSLLKWMHQQRRVDSSNARSYDYVKTVTIDHTKVTAAGAGFVTRIAGTDADLKTTANGGKSTSASGFDHAYFLDSALTERINAELAAFFDPVTGKHADYITPTTALSTSVDTVLYMGVGNPAVTLNQSDSLTTVWGANHKGVYHGKISGGLLIDSSGNGNHQTNNGGTAGTNATGDAYTLNGTTQNAQFLTGGILLQEPATISVVFNPTENTSTGVLASVSLNTPISPSVFMEIVRRPTGLVRASRWDGIAGAAANATSVGTFTVSAQNYAAGIFTSTSSRAIQVNTSADVADATALSAAANTDRAAVGAVYTNSAPGAFHAGTISEARYSNVVRSRAWRDMEYNNLILGYHTLGAATATQGVGAGGGGGGSTTGKIYRFFFRGFKRKQFNHFTGR